MITARDLYTSSDTYEDLPNTYNFVNALNFAKKKYRERTLDKNDLSFGDIIEILKVLIKDGQVFDDQILIIAALHNLLQNTITTESEIKSLYGPRVAECVRILKKEKTEPFAMYAKRIIENNTYPYLRKILLADILYVVRHLSESPYFLRAGNVKLEIKKMLLNYSHMLPRELADKINQEIM